MQDFTELQQPERHLTKPKSDIPTLSLNEYNNVVAVYWCHACLFIYLFIFNFLSLTLTRLRHTL